MIFLMMKMKMKMKNLKKIKKKNMMISKAYL